MKNLQKTLSTLKRQVALIESGFYDNIDVDTKAIDAAIIASNMLDDTWISRKDAIKYLNVSDGNFSVILHRCNVKKHKEKDLFRVGDIKRVKKNRCK